MRQNRTDPASPETAFEAGTPPWPTLIAAIGFNLVPILGVIFWHWSVFALILLYWTENVAVGARTLLSMLASGLAQGPASAVGAGALGVFFTFHYGLFCLGHGFFVLTMFGAGFLNAQGDGLFSVVGAVGDLLGRLPNFAAGLASIVIWQIVQFARFLYRGEAKTASASALMGAPYGRIVILHITIIFGGALVLSLGQPLWGLAALALIKTLFDVGAELSWGRKKRRAVDSSPVGGTI